MAINAIRVGVTLRIMQTPAYHEPRDALAQAWAPFLQEALPAAVWLMVPNLGAARAVEYCRQWGINRLIFSGGEDIGVAPARDDTELGLFDWAEFEGLPVLGICRGMELMCMRAGVDLQPVAGHVGATHRFEGELAGTANSFHSLSPSRCPPNYRVLARAEDGEIEAIRHVQRSWEGWMWHPEREVNVDSRDVERLRNLFA